jgi:hypothetical protein
LLKGEIEMSERHYAKSIEGIKAIIESIKPQIGECSNCAYRYGSSYERRTFLPKYRIKETKDGFEIEVWYVCSGCGAVR